VKRICQAKSAATTTTSTRPSRRRTRRRAWRGCARTSRKNVIRSAGGRGRDLHGRRVPDTAARGSTFAWPGHDYPLSRGRRVQRPGLRPSRRGVDGGGLLRGVAHGVPAFSGRSAWRRRWIPNWNRTRRRDSPTSSTSYARLVDEDCLEHAARRERRGCTYAATHRDGPRRDAARPPHLRRRAGPGRAGTVARARIPLVLCSSKTRAEIEALQQRLDIHHPFIAENGGAIVAPLGYFDHLPPSAVVDGGRVALALGRPHTEVVRALREVAAAQRVSVVGFSDMTVGDVAEEMRAFRPRRATGKAPRIRRAVPAPRA